MSKYTTEIRFLIESGFDFALDTYPAISEEYRTALNAKILDHYMFHEIGFETVTKFNHYLKSTMNEIMVYYNKLLESELLSINPLLTFERTTSSSKEIDNTVNQSIDNNTTLNNTTISNTDETQTKTDTSTQESETETSRNLSNDSIIHNQDVTSDTPMGLLDDGDVSANKYATDVKITDNTNDNTQVETISGTDDITKNDTSNNIINSNTTNTNNTTSSSDTTNGTVGNTVEVTTITENGFEISPTDLLMKYRETFLNVDMMIINDPELKQCFLTIY